MRDSAGPEIIQVEEVSLSYHSCALSSARDGGYDKAVKISKSRVRDGRPLCHSRIVDRGIMGTEIIPNHTWNGIPQVCEALVVLGATNELCCIETAMDAKLSEGKLEAIVS